MFQSKLIKSETGMYVKQAVFIREYDGSLKLRYRLTSNRQDAKVDVASTIDELVARINERLQGFYSEDVSEDELESFNCLNYQI